MPNLRVHASCYEAKHPQENLPRLDDPVALWRPSPEVILPPSAPVLEGELGSIILSWTESTMGEYQVNTYLIYRAVGGSGVFELLHTFAVTRDAFGARTNELTYTDENVEFETDYAYYVVGRPVKGPDSPNSNIVEFTTPAAQPDAPVLVGALNDDQEDSTVIRIAADEVGSFNGFTLSDPVLFQQVGSIVSGTLGLMHGVNPFLEVWEIIGGTNGTDFVISIFEQTVGIPPEADVFKRVQFTDRNAIARSVNAADAATDSTVTDGTTPGALSWTWPLAAQLFADGIEYDIEFFYQVPAFHLDWTAPAGDIDNYLLQRSVNGGAFALLATVEAPTTEYFDTAISDGNTYAYRVIAHPVAGADSDPSNTITFTAPTAPVLSTTIDQGVPEIALTWSASTVTGTTIRWYAIERQEDGGAFAFFALTDGATLAYTDQNVGVGVTYGYRVRGIPFLGVASANSNIESETVIEPDGIFFCTMGGDDTTSGNDGTVFGAPSSDLSTWTEHPVAAGFSFYDMASGGGTTMVGGSLGDGGEALYRSADLQNWTALDPWSGDVPVQCLAFGAAGVWVAGGGLGNGGGSTRLAWSDDAGDTWNDVASELAAGETPIACFYYENFVDLFFLATDARRIYTSPDGATWTEALGASGTYNFAAGAAIGEDDPSNIVMSFNGEHFRSLDSGASFTATTTPFATTAPLGMDENGSMFVTVGRDSGGTPRIFTSTDGSAWTERTVPAGVTSLSSVVWTGTQWIAVGAKGAAIEDICVISSSDGITWAEEATDIYVSRPRRII